MRAGVPARQGRSSSSRGADRGDSGDARSRRAGDHPAQPARLLFRRACAAACGEKTRVRELRHRADVTTSRAGDQDEICSARSPAAAAGVPLLRLPPHRARSAARSARASTCTTSARDRSRARSGCRRSFPSARIGRMDRDTVRGRARHGAAAGAAALRARSTCWSARR